MVLLTSATKHQANQLTKEHYRFLIATILSCSAIRTRSGSDRAPIFAITCRL